MIIDSHQHVMLPPEKQVKLMEQAGLDKVILFFTTPHPEKARNYAEFKEEMTRLYQILGGKNSNKDNILRMKKGNEELLRSIKAYPDKFYGFGGLPLGLTLEENKSWIQNDILGNGLKGVGEFTLAQEEQMRGLEQIFQALEDFPSLPIWIHTFYPVTENGLKILMELTRKYPTVPVIFGHGGGYHWQMLLEVAKTCPNAYIDLSATFSTLAAKMLIAELPERCFYSSDAPYGDPELSRMMIEHMSPSQEIADQVLGLNIARLLQLTDK